MVVEINISIVEKNVSIVEKNVRKTERFFDNHYKLKLQIFNYQAKTGFWGNAFCPMVVLSKIG